MSFVKKSIHTAVFRVIKILMGLGISIIIARMLGPHNKGILSAVTLIPTFIILLGGLGIEISNLYFTAQNRKNANRYYSNSIVFSGLLSIIFIPVGIGVFYLLRDRLFSDVSFKYLIIAVTVVPIGFLTKFLMGILLGFNKIEISNKIGFFLDTFNLAVLAGIAFSGHLSVSVMILLSVLTGSFNLMLLYLYLKKSIHLNFKLNPDFHNLKQYFSYGLKGHFSNILSFFNYRLDMFLVIYFLNPVQLGFYSISVAIAEKMWFLPDILSRILFPHVSTYKDKNITSILCRFVFAFMIGLSLIIVFVGKFAVILLYGKPYLPSIDPLLFLLPGIIFLSIAKLLSSDIMGRGRSDLTLISSAIAGISNLVLNLFLIPLYGIRGAAIASSFSYMAHTVYLAGRYALLSGQPWHSLFFLNKQDLKFMLSLLRKKSKK